MQPEDEDSTLCRKADKRILHVVKGSRLEFDDVTSNTVGFTLKAFMSDVPLRDTYGTY